MKIQLKIAVVVASLALLSSCQKEEMPYPDGCPTQDVPSNQRFMNPADNNQNNPSGNAIGDDFELTADTAAIVGGGDDDRDGGGIVWGGDDDKDGGSKKAEPKKP